MHKVPISAKTGQEEIRMMFLEIKKAPDEIEEMMR